VREPLFGSVDPVAALDDLRRRQINYDPRRAPLDGRPDGHWHVDSSDIVVGREPSGPPSPGGAWEVACLLVQLYEFTDPRLLRAVYRRDDELLGRNMLLEGRFFGLRFYFGVRVTAVIDETRGAEERVWGWSYQTLDGHLEQGRLSYEVIKDLSTGKVIFRVSGYSRRAPIADPVVRWGFRLFGRWTQARFYRSIQRRLHDLVQAAQRGQSSPTPAVLSGGVVIAPSRVRRYRPQRFARGWHHPGTD
jgi:hypothetical protein